MGIHSLASPIAKAPATESASAQADRQPRTAEDHPGLTARPLHRFLPIESHKESHKESHNDGRTDSSAAPSQSEGSEPSTMIAGPPAPVDGASVDGANLPIQRTIHINGQRMTHREVGQWKNDRNLDEQRRTLINQMHRAGLEYHYDSSAQLTGGLRAAVRRQDWETGAVPGPESRQLSPHDPRFKELHSQIMASHTQNPYATDALHEAGPLMGPWMNRNITRPGRAMRMGSALLRPSTWTGQRTGDFAWSQPSTWTWQRPDFEVSRIHALRNPALENQYALARQDIIGRAGAANERMLYSGHGAAGMAHIEQNGHDPSYGDYGARNWLGIEKGHGALGRGSYFTDRVDKAVSYSRRDLPQGGEGSFFMQNVLLGNSRELDQRGELKHRHHNEMVRGARNPGVNRQRPEGDAAPVHENMDQYDSVIGRETGRSGNGLLGTIRGRARFDSREHMVRNADQVLPKYRVYFR